MSLTTSLRYAAVGGTNHVVSASASRAGSGLPPRPMSVGPNQHGGGSRDRLEGTNEGTEAAAQMSSRLQPRSLDGTSGAGQALFEHQAPRPDVEPDQTDERHQSGDGDHRVLTAE
jgi:hypothetical protein